MVKKKISKKRKKSGPDRTLSRRIFGLALVTVSLFLLLSIILSQKGGLEVSQVGPAGHLLSKILLGFLGRAGIVVPSVGLVLGCLSLLGYREDPIVVNLAGFFLIVLSLLALFSVPLIQALSFLEGAQMGLEGLGGGLLGMSLAWGLVRLLGPIGAHIFLVGLGLAGLLLFFDGFHSRPLKKLFSKLKRGRGEKKTASKRPGLKASEKRSEKKEKEERKQEEDKPPSVSEGTVEADNYQNIRGILMDEDIGKKAKDISGGQGPDEGQKTKLKAKAKEEKEDAGLEAQLHFALAQDKGQEKESWSYPSLLLLRQVNHKGQAENKKEVEKTARVLEETLESFGVRLKIDQISIGPTITRYEAKLAPGVKVSKILRLADDIALSLAASNIRIEAPIPGKAAIGIEVPNQRIREVSMREIMGDPAFTKGQGRLLVGLGQDIAGKTVVADLAKMPHLLVAGATGSGKSVCMNVLICSLLFNYRPDEMKLLMIDPKKVEFGHYNQLPHLLAPVITEAKKAAVALKWMANEMENRYSLFAQEGVKDLYAYNARIKEKNDKIEDAQKKIPSLPNVVILIDELSDLMMVSPTEVEDTVCRLAQMARAAGMHLVIATQRPSVNVITGLIKANIPSRIAFAVSSQVDSRTILDKAGAERLLGRGDMLYAPVGLDKARRIQGANITEREVEKIVSHLKSQEKPDYSKGVEMLEKVDLDEFEDDQEGQTDELLWEAGQLVVSAGQASISMLQRRLKIGYNRAARIVDQLEERGIIGGFQGPKARELLVGEETLEKIRLSEEEGPS